MNAEQLLAQYQISLDEALNWILSNLEDPALIYNTALSYGIDSDMLAEIVSPVYPDLSAQQVEDFFSGYGLNGAALNPSSVNSGGVNSGGVNSGGVNSGGVNSGSLEELNPLTIQLIQMIVQPNDNTGILSTDYLKQQIVSKTGQAAYDEFFAPELYDSDGDGYLSEVGSGGDLITEFNLSTESVAYLITQLNLSTESFESIYFGTIINVFKAIDKDESIMLDQLDPNASEDSYLQALITVFEDEATPPLIPDSLLSQAIILSTATAINGFDGESYSLNPSDLILT